MFISWKMSQYVLCFLLMHLIIWEEIYWKSLPFELFYIFFWWRDGLNPSAQFWVKEQLKILFNPVLATWYSMSRQAKLQRTHNILSFGHKYNSFNLRKIQNETMYNICTNSFLYKTKYYHQISDMTARSLMSEQPHIILL